MRPFLYPGMPPYGLIGHAQSAFRKARQRFVEKPDLRLLHTAWELLELGHADLAADIVAMADPVSRVASSSTVHGMKMTDTKLAVLLVRPGSAEALRDAFPCYLGKCEAVANDVRDLIQQMLLAHRPAEGQR